MNVSLVAWEFNGAAFASAVMALHESFTWGELGEIIGVSPSTVNNWGRGNWHGDFPFPNMSNFLTVCNEADLDPREFFILEDK